MFECVSTKYVQQKNPNKVCGGARCCFEKVRSALNLQVSHRSLNKSSVLIPPHNPGIPAAVSYTAQRAAKTLIMSKSANNSQFLYSNRILFFLQLSSVGMFEQEFTTTLILSSIFCTSVPRECPPPPARRARVTQTAYSD